MYEQKAIYAGSVPQNAELMAFLRLLKLRDAYAIALYDEDYPTIRKHREIAILRHEKIEQQIEGEFHRYGIKTVNEEIVAQLERRTIPTVEKTCETEGKKHVWVETACFGDYDVLECKICHKTDIRTCNLGIMSSKFGGGLN